MPEVRQPSTIWRRLHGPNLVAFRVRRRYVCPGAYLFVHAKCYSFFGAAYGTIDHYLHLGYYLIAAAIIVLVILLYLQRQFAEDFARKWGDE